MELHTLAARATVLCALFALALALAVAGEAGEAAQDPAYFSEGGKRSSDLGLSVLAPKHNVTARKGAGAEPPTSSSENSKPEGVVAKDLQPVALPPVGTAQRNSSNTTPDIPPVQTGSLRSNNTLKQNASSTEAPAQIPTAAVSSAKSVMASDKPVDSSTKSTEAPLASRKSNPHITVDTEDLPIDENGHVIVSKENLVGADPSFDFVVPIVIALLAVPFVAVLGAYAYKKSRDFWDRRHYRRMDFLIDGMYND